MRETPPFLLACEFNSIKTIMKRGNGVGKLAFWLHLCVETEEQMRDMVWYGKGKDTGDVTHGCWDLGIVLSRWIQLIYVKGSMALGKYEKAFARIKESYLFISMFVRWEHQWRVHKLKENAFSWCSVIVEVMNGSGGPTILIVLYGEGVENKEETV